MNLQAQCDAACEPGGSKVVDLEGRLVVSPRVILGPQHNGLRVFNGAVYSPSDKETPEKRYGIFELAKGITLNGRHYQDAPLNVAFSGVEFIGPQTNFTDDGLLNGVRSREQGAFCAGVNAMNGSKVDSISFRRCKFRNMFSGIGAFYTIRLGAYQCEFERIATQCCSSLLDSDGPNQVFHTLTKCKARDCGSLFDFSAPANSVGKEPRFSSNARVEGCEAINSTGRAKVYGMWSLVLDDSEFKLTRPFPARYAGISLPQCALANLSRVRIENYTCGVQCTDWVVEPFVDIRESEITGAQMAINSTSRQTHVDGLRLDRCLYPWGTEPATQSGVVITNPTSVDEQASRFKAMQSMVRDWNRLHGTTYDPDRFWWISNEVRNRMQQIEGN